MAGRQGFTLLEVILAISLMGVLAVIGLIFYVNAGDKVALRKAAIAIEAMSSRGHAMAVLHQKPFWLEIREGEVLLMGADLEPSAPDEEEGGPPAWLDEDEAEEKGAVVVYDTYNGDAVVSLRRWGERENWIRPVEDEWVTWEFQSTGLCEPVAIRLESNESWIVMHMNPLTARVDEEEMAIQ